MEPYYPIFPYILGLATYHVWACYRKERKGFFNGGEIDFTVKSRLK